MVWSMMGSSPPSSANFSKVLSLSAKLVLSRMRFWPSDTTISGVEELVHIYCCTIEVVCVYGAREGTRGGGHACPCSSQPQSYRTGGIVWPVCHGGQASWMSYDSHSPQLAVCGVAFCSSCEFV